MVFYQCILKRGRHTTLVAYIKDRQARVGREIMGAHRRMWVVDKVFSTQCKEENCLSPGDLPHMD